MKLYNNDLTKNLYQYYNEQCLPIDELRNRHTYTDLIGRFPQTLWVARAIRITSECLDDGLTAGDDLYIPAGSMIYWYVREDILMTDYYYAVIVSPIQDKKITVLCMKNLKILYRAYAMNNLVEYDKVFTTIADRRYKVTYVESEHMYTDIKSHEPYVACIKTREKDYVLSGLTPVDVIRACADAGISLSKNKLCECLATYAIDSEPTEPDKEQVMLSMPNMFANEIKDIFAIDGEITAMQTQSESQIIEEKDDATKHTLYRDYWYTAPGICIRHADTVKIEGDKIYLDEYVFDIEKDLNSTYFVDRNKAMEHFM